MKGWRYVGKSSIGLRVLQRSASFSRFKVSQNDKKRGKKEKKKKPNCSKEAVCSSSWAYPHHPSLQPMVLLQFNWLGTRICLFKTTSLLLQPLQKSESLLRDCWANAAILFQKPWGIVWKNLASVEGFELSVKWYKLFICLTDLKHMSPGGFRIRAAFILFKKPAVILFLVPGGLKTAWYHFNKTAATRCKWQNDKRQCKVPFHSSDVFHSQTSSKVFMDCSCSLVFPLTYQDPGHMTRCPDFWLYQQQ